MMPGDRLGPYVRPFPGGGGGKWQISAGGWNWAFWSNKAHVTSCSTSLTSSGAESP